MVSPVGRDGLGCATIASVPVNGHWKEVLNSDAPLYGGNGLRNSGLWEAVPVRFDGRPTR